MGGIAAVAGRGRKPKPSKKSNTPNFGKVIDIAPPDYFCDLEFASMMWRSIVPELLKNEVIRITDMHNVEAFCIAYDNYRQCQAEVATNGVVVKSSAGGSIKNPALTGINEAMRQMAMFGAMLGLDPSSRQRLTGGGKKEKTNSFASVLNM